MPWRSRSRRRSYRSRYTRKTRYRSRNRSIKKSKGIYSRLRLRGQRYPLNRKSELKYVDYRNTIATTISTATQWTLIWGLNELDSASTEFFPAIPQGVTNSSRIGNSINMYYAELRVRIFPLPFTTDAWSGLRVVLAKSKNPDISWSANLFPPMLVPIDFKVVDVQYDKVMYHTSGSTSNNAPTAPNTTSLYGKPFELRFVIPLKRTIEFLNNVADDFTWPEDMWLGMTSLTANSYRVGEVVCRYYYRDP